jgi:hypothetical protein
MINIFFAFISICQDDETIPKELRNTKEYWEILQLKRLKRKRAEQQHMVSFSIIFKCVITVHARNT